MDHQQNQHLIRTTKLNKIIMEKLLNNNCSRQKQTEEQS